VVNSQGSREFLTQRCGTLDYSWRRHPLRLSLVGKVVYLPLQQLAAHPAEFDIPRHVFRIHSFAKRAEAERAAQEVAAHLAFPDDVVIVERRRRLRTRFELAVDATDVRRATAVLQISDRARSAVSPLSGRGRTDAG